MSEELRENKVREVVALFRQAALLGTPVMVSPDGTRVGVTYSAGYGAEDEVAGEEALAEAFERGAAGQPFIVELKALTETEEGREILLEAYRRWREEEEDY
jgi:ribosomal protein S12 methylthiotransferase accessory factor YcaO